MTCCSTSRTPIPRSRATSRTAGSSDCTMIGARPRLSSSIIKSFGRAASARAIANICCSPPDMRPARRSMIPARAGNGASAVSTAFGSRLGAARRRCSRPVSPKKSARSSGTWARPRRVSSSARFPARRRPVARGRDTEHASLAGEARQQARDRQQGGRLAGAVRPQQRDDLTREHLEVDLVHDRHAVVARREATQFEHGRGRGGGRAHVKSPRYAATTAGSWRTARVGPLAMTRPRSSTVSSSQTSSTSVMSWSTSSTPTSTAGKVRSNVAERNGLGGIEPGGGLVEHEHLRLRRRARARHR